MSQVIIRRYGTLIELSPDGSSPLDQRIVDLLSSLLTYEHKYLLRGNARFTPDGTTRNMDIELKYMYAIEQGRLVTGFGFLTSIVRILQSRGIQVHYIDTSPPKAPGVYTPNWENVYRLCELRPKQLECLQAIASNQCGILNATMGFGKTYLLEQIVNLYPTAKFDIVVRPKDVARRIVRQLSRTVPNVGFIGDSTFCKGERVTVYTAGSAHHAEGSDADFLLADEVHQLVTSSTSVTIGRSWRWSRNFGFSATTKGRMDGADAMLELFFGPEIFKLTYQEAVDLGLVVPIKVRWIPIQLPQNPAAGHTGVPQMRWGIWRNEQRNRLVAEDIRTMYPDPDTQILILVATVEHAVHLWQHLQEFSLCYGGIDDDMVAQYKRNRMLPNSFQVVDGQLRDQMRDDFESGKLKRVIATDVWSTGVDFANLQVLYRLDARQSEIMDAQGPGRVSRISPSTGKQYGEVVDCCDIFDTTFFRKSEARKRHYRALGWAQDWPRIL